MKGFNRKEHWENIYRNKKLEEVSWFQPVPETSLDFFENYDLPLDAKIIDVGGGDSFLVDILLEKGYRNITVLDVSKHALERAKKRLGKNAEFVTWITGDVTEFKSQEKYDFWHDRAVFHFLTTEQEIDSYVKIVKETLKHSAVLVIGTFSKTGPESCSGIKIKQYSETDLIARFKPYFVKDRCIKVDHTTPASKIQNFTFCSFKKTN